MDQSGTTEGKVENGPSLSPVEADAPASLLKDPKAPAVAPNIASPPASEPDLAGGGDSQQPQQPHEPQPADAPAPAGEGKVDAPPAETKTDVAQPARVNKPTTTEFKFVPFVMNEPAVGPSTEPSTDTNSSVQTQMLKEQLPEATDPGEAAEAAHEALMAGVPPTALFKQPPETLPETQAPANPAELVVGEKRKADDSEAGAKEMAAEGAAEVGAPAEETGAVAGAEKKLKTNEGEAAPQPQRKNSKSAKTKKAPAATGKTARKTRSQGPA